MTRIIYTEPSCDQYFPASMQYTKESLQNYVIAMGESLKQANNIEEEYTYNLSNPIIEEAFLYGILYSSIIDEGDCKFSLKECNLSLPTHFNRKDVKLFFDPTVKNLFRGEIIAVSGKYANGNLFVSKVYTNCRTAPPNAINPRFEIKIAVATGPFADASLEQTNELNSHIKEISPDKAIFLGPVCTNNSSILMDTSSEGPIETPDTLSDAIIKTLSDGIEESIFISSPDDAAGLPLLPSPRIFDSGMNYFCTGNPCMLQIGELDIYAIAYNSLDKIEEQVDGIVEASCLAQQCNGMPTVAREMVQNNIATMKAKRSPHIYIVSGKEKVMEWEGTKTIAVPEWCSSKKVAVIHVAEGKTFIDFV